MNKLIAALDDMAARLRQRPEAERLKQARGFLAGLI